MNSKVLPDLGGVRLADVERRDLQRLADRMLAKGADPSTIRNMLMPLRVIYRRAIEDGDIAINPTEGLRLPAVRAVLVVAIPGSLRAEQVRDRTQVVLGRHKGRARVPETLRR